MLFDYLFSKNQVINRLHLDGNAGGHGRSADNKINIAGRLPEDSRNSFVDLQSQKTSKKKTDQKIRFFTEG